MLKEQNTVNIIGAGLAGCECAYILATNGIKVKLYEMKKIKKTEAHKSDDLAELVCSNSLKSERATNACGLLKKEMQILGSLFVEAAYATKVEAGQALAVDRDAFSKYITEKIYENDNIEVIDKEIEDISDLEGITVIATGPLTSDKLSSSIQKLLGEESLYFYDAAAPIISADSINMKIAYRMDRYGEEGSGDYLNLPMNKTQYEVFYNELINAEQAERHEFDKLVLFENCMPIEHMAKRGEKTLLFGPLKPVGLNDPKTGQRMYAVVQLRAENKEGTLYNLVGFQTSLKFKEQERILKYIPGLENVNIVRYGVMHRNTYINSSKVLNQNFCLKQNNNIYFAGQISGVEGYVESAASGMMVAYSILSRLNNEDIVFPDTTMLGSLAKYISSENKNFQPMNANFGIILPLEINNNIKDKKLKYEMLSDRALKEIENFKNNIRK
ncbi:MAG: methylenetetrahydrofolate--tRNA-(uracil(54)-C(5))-methyltransferase (FADH(2)-oxidizing) TrmFO [Clostridia bacterium]|nr:methylenetetrahydrofolate--tRNA-(uracil(54)-C(5))-methyltransferase (FADH(2)-oxidizing) TrmFO [Clostridia bacterium]